MDREVGRWDAFYHYPTSVNRRYNAAQSARLEAHLEQQAMGGNHGRYPFLSDDPAGPPV